MFPIRKRLVRATAPRKSFQLSASAQMSIAVTVALVATLLLPATSLAFFSTDDGEKIVFETPQRLASADTDHTWDIYKRAGGVTSLVSQGEINGNGPIKAFFDGASSDASTVFFRTAERLARGDIDGSTDIYKRAAGRTILVSTSQAHPNGSFEASFDGASNNGSKAFFSTSEQLAGADTDDSADIYERSGGGTRLVSKGEVNGNGDFDAFVASPDCVRLSAASCGFVTSDGSKVFFSTNEQLVSDDTDGGARDLYERSGGTTKLVTKGQINGNGFNYAYFQDASADGSKLWFMTDEPLVSADTDSAEDVYERSGGVTTPVSRGQINGNGDFDSDFDGMSGDGSIVWFHTREPLVSADTDDAVDLYQRSGEVTTLISRAQATGNGDFDVSFSGASNDGSRVFFSTEEQLVAGDVNDVLDGYQRAGGKTTWVTQGPVTFIGPSHGAFIHAIANDGATIFFDTDEPKVDGDNDSAWDSYKRSGGTTTQVTRGEINGSGPFDANFLGCSTDGSKAFFGTQERLLRADGDNTFDIYERSDGTTKLLSR